MAARPVLLCVEQDRRWTCSWRPSIDEAPPHPQLRSTVLLPPFFMRWPIFAVPLKGYCAWQLHPSVKVAD